MKIISGIIKKLFTSLKTFLVLSIVIHIYIIILGNKFLEIDKADKLEENYVYFQVSQVTITPSEESVEEIPSLADQTEKELAIVKKSGRSLKIEEIDDSLSQIAIHQDKEEVTVQSTEGDYQSTNNKNDLVNQEDIESKELIKQDSSGSSINEALDSDNKNTKENNITMEKSDLIYYDNTTNIDDTNTDNNISGNIKDNINYPNKESDKEYKSEENSKINKEMESHTLINNKKNIVMTEAKVKNLAVTRDKKTQGTVDSKRDYLIEAKIDIQLDNKIDNNSNNTIKNKLLKKTIDNVAGQEIEIKKSSKVNKSNQVDHGKEIDKGKEIVQDKEIDTEKELVLEKDNVSNIEKYVKVDKKNYKVNKVISTDENEEIEKEIGVAIGAENEIEATRLDLTKGSIGKGVRPPDVLTHMQPVYPERLRKRGIEAKVLIKALLDTNGKVINTILAESSAYEQFDRSAVEAVKNWEFKPAIKDNIEVESWILIPILFKLK